MTDRELLIACQQSRSSELFTQLAMRHVHLVYSVAYRHVKEYHLAHDITQDVFVALFHKLPLLDPQAPLIAWLFTAAHLQALQSLRAESRRHRHEREVAMSQDASATPDPMWSLIVDDLNHAVASLVPTERDAILLRYFAGKSHQEIASDLSISEEAARKRVQRGVESLRELLTSHGVMIPAAALATALGAHAAAYAAPPAVVASISQFSLQLAAPAPPVAAATLKGILMTSARFKAAAIAAVVLAILVSISIVVVQHAMSPAVGSSVAVPADVAAPIARIDFTQSYALKDGQVMRRVVNVPPEIRNAMFHATLDPIQAGRLTQANQSPRLPEPNGPMLIQWEGERPRLRGTTHLEAFPLQTFILTLVREFPQDVEGDARDISIPGDFAIKAGATPEQFRIALQDILQNDLKQNVTLSYRDVMRKVIVFHGQWKFHAVDAGAAATSNPTIQLYTAIPNLYPDKGPMGICNNTLELAGWIGSWIQESVIIEADGIPARVDWQGNADDDSPPNGNLKARDPAVVLDHITEQTGLAWTAETRTVRRLFIETTRP